MDVTTQPGSGNAIELRRVEKRYGSETALYKLDLDIKEGEFFCLLGPSGCGKTTTLNLIGGFVEPSGGTVSIRGRDVTSLPPHRRPVNTVFQSYALFPHLSVAENVAFGLRMAGVAKSEQIQRAREALELVGLDDFGSRRVQQLSGGQAQRVAIARALVNRPSVLLLDEPLGALDLKLRKRLQVELSMIHRRVGTTFVFVTHDQEEAMALADRIAVLDGGRVQQIGSPTEIYLRPRNRFVAEFIGESNLISGHRDGDVFRTAGGEAVPCAPGTPPQATALIVRPESLRLGSQGHLPAEVVSVAFLGPMTRVALAVKGSDTLLAATLSGHVPDAVDGIALEPGAQVHVSWTAQAAHALTEPDSAGGTDQ